MAEQSIPPVFRSALDEPSPPEPPEIEPERDDDGGHACVQPRVILFSDWAVSTSGRKGTLLVGWYWLASAVTLWTVGSTIWGWLSATVVAVGLVVWLFSVGAAVTVLVGLQLGGQAWGWWTRRCSQPMAEPEAQP